MDMNSTRCRYQCLLRIHLNRSSANGTNGLISYLAYLASVAARTGGSERKEENAKKAWANVPHTLVGAENRIKEDRQEEEEDADFLDNGDGGGNGMKEDASGAEEEDVDMAR